MDDVGSTTTTTTTTTATTMTIEGSPDDADVAAQVAVAREDAAVLTPPSGGGQASPPVVYENDFDLYSMLKEMIIRRASMKRVAKKKSANSKSTSGLKDYSKALTARLLDSHFADGRGEWALIDNGMDLYRGKVNCIGTEVADFDYGDPVFLDLQPLSTRIRLMCKLIIIIQGACLERAGPPKLVQDRCLQFDGVHERRVDSMAREHLDSITVNSNHLPKIKSNSCDNLLTGGQEEDECSLFTYLRGAPERAEETTAGPAKLSVFGTSSSSTTGRQPSRQVIDRKYRKKPTAGGSSSGAISDDEALLETYSSHHYHQHHHYYHQCGGGGGGSGGVGGGDDGDSNLLVSSSCDLESYFRYRISKCSVKDYASAPYYQYGCARSGPAADKGTNTADSYLSRLSEAKTPSGELRHQANKATCTDDLLSGFEVGYFSKSQLMSSQSLFGKKTSLMTSYASISLESAALDKTVLSARSKVPIQINFRNKSQPPGATATAVSAKPPDAESVARTSDIVKIIDKPASPPAVEKKDQQVAKTTSAAAVSTSTVAATAQVTSFKFAAKEPVINITIPTAATCTFKYSSDLIRPDPNLESIKAGPKKSKDWSLFKPDINLFSKKAPESSASTTEKSAVLAAIVVEQDAVPQKPPLLSKTTVITTTTTTTTTKKTRSPTETPNTPPPSLQDEPPAAE